MSNPICESKTPLICGVCCFMTVSAITLLVMGILGATSAVPMAPVGAEIMLTLSIVMIFGMISRVVNFLMRN